MRHAFVDIGQLDDAALCGRSLVRPDEIPQPVAVQRRYAGEVKDKCPAALYRQSPHLLGRVCTQFPDHRSAGEVQHRNPANKTFCETAHV